MFTVKRIVLYNISIDRNNLWTAPVDFSRTRSQLNRHCLRLLIYFFRPHNERRIHISSDSGQKAH